MFTSQKLFRWLIICILVITIIFASLPTIPKLLSNLKTLCYTELALNQTGDFNKDLTTIYNTSKDDLFCKSLWKEHINSNTQTEIHIDAPNLYKGRGRLYELSEEQVFSNKYAFGSFVKLSMSQRDHEVFETIDIPIGVYELQIHAMNDQPGPVEINVYAEKIPIGTLEYNRDDGSWETNSLLLQPIHWNIQNDVTDRLTIRITFENAVPKRVANIAWLRIKSLSGSVIHE